LEKIIILHQKQKLINAVVTFMFHVIKQKQDLYYLNHLD